MTDSTSDRLVVAPDGALRTPANPRDLPRQRPAWTPSGRDALDVRRLVVPLPRGPLVIADWQVRIGEKVALIGRNGVGKTSISEALLGLREEARVDAWMLGHPINEWRRRPVLRKRLGAQLQRVAFPGRPRVSELVALHRAVYDRTSDAVLEALGIPALAARLYEFLSRGETQRVDLFLALAHQPEILFLDEPFTGLDPQFARKLGGLIREMDRSAIVMSCHTVEELTLVDRVAWLADSGIVRYDTPDVLRRELVGDYRLVARCDDEPGAQRLGYELGQVAARGRRISVDSVRVQVCSSDPLADLARTLVDRPGVQAVEAGRSSLADLLRYCANEV